MSLSHFVRDPFALDFVNDPFFGQNSLLGTWLDKPLLTRGALSNFQPSMDICERGKDILIKCELPGMNKEDVNIEINDGRLNIFGEKKEEKTEGKEGDKFYRMERRYGSFRRSIEVPKNLKETDIKANFKNGLLEITFPKMQADSAPKRIQLS